LALHALIIPAAGLGTRMRSVNPHLPKELLPLGGKPAIQYAIEEGIDAGVEKIIVIISPQKEILRQHLLNLPVHIDFVYQQQPRGEADAIALAESLAEGHDLGIIYPDNLYLPAPGGLKCLQAVYAKTGADVLALSPVSRLNSTLVGNSGRVDLAHQNSEIYRILRFHPKIPGFFQPRFSVELRTCGLMVTGSHLFDFIRRAREDWRQGEYTDEPVRRLLLKERGLLGVWLPGRVHDIGNPEGYAFCSKQLCI
jgi:UTP--glucose-1-phosphate uridylyltransferase